MGGGHLSRGALTAGEPDKSYPLTEFYLLLQKAAQSEPFLQLPACSARFTPPENTYLYDEDMDEYCRFVSRPVQGLPLVFAARKMRVGYQSLSLSGEGIPSALLFSEEGTHREYALRLLPPSASAGIYLPPPPRAYAVLELALSFEDMDAADRDPDKLGCTLLLRTEGKAWLAHPMMARWRAEALSLLQKKRRHLR